jgi:hypothetical protein
VPQWPHDSGPDRPCARGERGARGNGRALALLVAAVLTGCSGGSDDGGPADTGVDAGSLGCVAVDPGPQLDGNRPADPFADRVVSFCQGGGAGFGQERLPGVVLGPPRGGGNGSGSLDVLSLGNGGNIVLEFTDVVVVDGEGVDLLVFENPFGPFLERGWVAVSDDGITFHEFPCAAADADGRFAGCAGVRPVSSTPENGVSATDPVVAGGDGFDLADVGLSRARFVRIRDSGANPNLGPLSAGFDLDAVAVVNGAPLDAGVP